MRRRRTLAGPVVFDGVGLHRGEPGRLVVSPREGRGYLLARQGEEALVERLATRGDERGTTLVFPGGARVQTVEHLLAALRGLDIDDVRLSFEGPEPPVLDGGSALFAGRLMEAGIVEKEEAADVYSVPLPLVVRWGDRLAAALPGRGFHVTYVIDYENPLIGTRRLSRAVTPSAFVERIAPARTFCLERDLENLRSRGLARGGTLENAVVVGEGRILNPGGLLYDDEFVRHKILDLVGDLALLGRPLEGHFLAIAAGHDLHQALVERLRPFIAQGRVDS